MKLNYMKETVSFGRWCLAVRLNSKSRNREVSEIAILLFNVKQQTGIVEVKCIKAYTQANVKLFLLPLKF